MATKSDTICEDDSSLWECILTGNQDAFSQLYQRYHPQILSFLLARCRGRISGEDLAQEVWVRALRKKSQCDGTNVKAWIFQIARNLLKDRMISADLRKVRNTENVTDRVAPSLDETHATRLEAMRQCLKQHGGEFVKVLMLQLDGKTVEQIANELGVATNTVYSRTSRGKAQIKDCVEKRLL